MDDLDELVAAEMSDARFRWAIESIRGRWPRWKWWLFRSV